MQSTKPAQGDAKHHPDCPCHQQERRGRACIASARQLGWRGDGETHARSDWRLDCNVVGLSENDADLVWPRRHIHEHVGRRSRVDDVRITGWDRR